MRWAVSIMVLCLLAGYSGAWGHYSSRFVCHEAVKFAWGADAVAGCLPSSDALELAQFCDAVYSVMGGEAEAKCRKSVSNGTLPHPSLVSYQLFGDTGSHYDFSRCPINEGTSRMWVCGDGSSPALNMYWRWIQAAESAPTLCVRIYDFCVAASYYADAESSLHQVRYISNHCDMDIEASIDRCMEAGTGDCGSSMVCQFDNRDRGLGMMFARQKMGESSSTLGRVVANLTVEGLRLKAMPLTPMKGVVVLVNSIDLPAAAEAASLLRAGGVNAIVSNASDFERLRYNLRVVVVGGQNAPEGVGVVASQVMSQEDEALILKTGASGVFVKDGQWMEGQKVVVVAGNEAADTARELSDSFQMILSEVR